MINTKTRLTSALLFTSYGLFSACKPVSTANSATVPRRSATAATELQTVSAAPTIQPHGYPAHEPSKARESSLTRSSYDKCVAAASGATPALENCISNEYSYQDKRLNVAYQKALAARSGRTRVDLRASQREWLRNRDIRCVVDVDGGQAARLDALECRLEATAARAIELEGI